MQETLHRRCPAARVLKHTVCLHSSVHLSFTKPSSKLWMVFVSLLTDEQSEHRLENPSVQRFTQQLMGTKTCLYAFQDLEGFSPPLSAQAAKHTQLN
ncbi:hypothetical protein QQF64_033735 [Cirrhinus molitorella]|uniref:Uncharacterized protein n=1 Tax=Cirrhinus molitorella TaxID=172907 RepID=A0ABR3MUU9_9TELE